MGKNKGAALFQYVIIIALIALALVPVLMTFGDQIKTALTNIVNNQMNINKQMDANSPESLDKIKAGTLKGGDLGGKPSAPVEACLKTVCSIDYGTFVLNGIPADFGTIVESSGSSGGTDEIAKIAEQVAQILQDQGNTDGANEFRQFANLAYFQAEFKKGVESYAKTCLPNDPAVHVTCFNGAYNGGTLGVTLPASLSTILSDFNTFNPASLTSKVVNDYIRNDYARNIMNTNPADFTNYSTRYPSFAMVNMYNNIQNQTNATYSPEVRNIASRLYQCISDISFESSLISQNLGTGGSSNSLEKFDVFTGASKGSITAPTTLDLNDIVKPKYGDNIDVRGSLLCGVGHNYTDNHECK